jgi:hypothetical protein
MLLSVAIEDLLASELEVRLSHVDGRLSCDFKPNVHHKRDSPTHQASSGGIINIRSVWGEHGYVLGDRGLRWRCVEPRGLPRHHSHEYGLRSSDLSRHIIAAQLFPRSQYVLQRHLVTKISCGAAK